MTVGSSLGLSDGRHVVVRLDREVRERQELGFRLLGTGSFPPELLILGGAARRATLAA